MWDLIKTYKKNDPVQPSGLEIILLYPGVKALALHRIAHALEKAGVPFVPRAIAEFSRWLTGIEIHPGAQIGANLFIDHGLGLVIGQTAVIGNNCKLYHGVTLGGVDMRPVKRHPTLEDDVLVGAGAKLLGNIRIGRGSKIGANAVVTKDVAPLSVVSGIPGRAILQSQETPGDGHSS
jgi:serine O-acetyltransferase